MARHKVQCGRQYWSAWSLVSRPVWTLWPDRSVHRLAGCTITLRRVDPARPEMEEEEEELGK